MSKRKKQWLVRVAVEASRSVQVTAKTEEEAKERAMNMVYWDEGYCYDNETIIDVMDIREDTND